MIGFVSSFCVTLAFLGAAVFTGIKAQRRRHLPLVFLSLISLGVTIWFAERLGESYDLEASGIITPIHLFLAKLATLAYILPLVTGPLVIRRAERLHWHRISAIIVLILTVAAACTGLAMVWMAEPLA